jgi:DNA-binding NtrC family response regulator
VESAPGRGSTFSVLVPRSPKPPAPLPERAPRRPPPTPRPLSILLVEDNPEVREAANEMLVLAGYVVTAVAGPGAAVEAASARSYDLLVTDVVLPEMSGQRLADRLSASRPGLRVLYISGHADVVAGIERIDRARLLRKPFSMDELLEAIDRVSDPTGAAADERDAGRHRS